MSGLGPLRSAPLTAAQVLARLNANATIALTAPLTTTQQITSTVVTGTAPFVVASTTQVANLNVSQLIGGTWAIPGSIGATTPNAGAFTTLSASGAFSVGGSGSATINCDLATALKIVPSNAVTAFYNSSGAAIYGSAGSAAFPFNANGNLVLEARGGGTPRSVVLASAGGSFIAYLDTTGSWNIPVATGTAPLVVASTTVVANLNASLLLGSTWASPGSIGATAPAAGAFTTLGASGIASLTNTTEASAVGTAGAVLSGGLGVAKRSFLGTIGSTFRGNVLAGVQDGTAAVSGQVGEEIESTISVATNAAATGTYLALTSITLTPGDWDISGTVELQTNSATISGAAQWLIGTTSASAAGSTEPYDFIQFAANLMSGGMVWPTTIARKRVSITTSTTYYVNALARFSAGTPQWVGTISARRTR